MTTSAQVVPNKTAAFPVPQAAIALIDCQRRWLQLWDGSDVADLGAVLNWFQQDTLAPGLSGAPDDRVERLGAELEALTDLAQAMGRLARVARSKVEAIESKTSSPGAGAARRRAASAGSGAEAGDGKVKAATTRVETDGAEVVVVEVRVEAVKPSVAAKATAPEAPATEVSDIQERTASWHKLLGELDGPRRKLETIRQRWASTLVEQRTVQRRLFELRRAGHMWGGQIGRSLTLLLALLVLAGGVKVLLIEQVFAVDLVRGLEWAAFSLVDLFKLSFAVLGWVAGALVWHALTRRARKQQSVSALPSVSRCRWMAAGSSLLTLAAVVVFTLCQWRANANDGSTCITRIGNQCVRHTAQGVQVHRLTLEPRAITPDASAARR